MGWFGVPGGTECSCCDQCDPCLNYSQTFDGSGTLALIDWTSSGEVARVSGVVQYLGSDPTAQISNSTDATRLTGDVRTTFEFRLTYNEAGMGVSVAFTTGGAARIYLVNQYALAVYDVSSSALVALFPISLTIDEWYTFEICVDDASEVVHVGIRQVVYYEDSITNDGLDYVTILGYVTGEYIPAPPGGDPDYSYPEDVILEVDNFYQYDRQANSSECCQCEPFPTGSVTEIPDPVLCFCTTLTSTILLEFQNIAAGGGGSLLSCCTALNDSYVLDFLYQDTRLDGFTYCAYGAFFDCDDDTYPCCGDGEGNYVVNQVWVQAIFRDGPGAADPQVEVIYSLHDAVGNMLYQIVYRKTPITDDDCGTWSEVEATYVSSGGGFGGASQFCDASSSSVLISAVV